jgi:hypothetical protein
MGHEDAVYLAKLAEQAERYEGAFGTSFCPEIASIETKWWSNMRYLQRW